MVYKVYQWFQAFSLDVVVGCMVMSLAISRYLNLRIHYSSVVCLGLSVWLIYTFDHLVDAYKTKKKAATFRHRAHQKYFYGIITSCFVLGICEIYLLFKIPFGVFYYGLMGSFYLGCYFFLLQTKTFWLKEVFIALGYTMGVFLVPFSSLVYVSWSFWMLVLQVFLIALSNLFLFSWFDYHKDLADDHYSIVFWLGPEKTKKGIVRIILLGIAFCIVMPLIRFGMQKLVFQSILFCMNVALLFLIRRNQVFGKQERYRMIGDGIFYLPSLFLLYDHLIK